MKIRYAKKSEKEIAIKFWKDSFKDSEEQIKFYFDNIYNEKNYLILEDNSKIVSSLHENDYIFNFNNESIKSKYIVGVSSDITMRNKGYMSKLLISMLENSKKKDMPFVFLTPKCMALDGISYKEILALIYGYRDYYKNVSLASPNNSNLEFLFENQLSIEKIVKPFMMMRILNPLAIFKNLKLENHNIYIYIEDKILKENTGLYYFLNKKFTFYALPVEKSIYHLRIDIADLVFLITGYFSIDDLVKMGKIDISNKETLRKLKRIFSKKNSYLYEFI